MTGLDFGARALAVRARQAALLSGTRTRRGVVVAGDSITQGATVDAFDGNQFFSGGFAEAAVYRSRAGFHLVGNSGVAGNTSTQLLARFGSDVLARRPDLVLLTIGTNDVGANGIDAGGIARLMTNLEQMIGRTLAAGALPIIVTPPPKDGAGTSVNDPVRAGVRGLIPYYYWLAEAHGVPLLDIFAPAVDPMTGGWRAGWSDDGIHPNPAGVDGISRAVASALQHLPDYRHAPYFAAVSEPAAGSPANLIRNGGFAQQTVPGVPDGWTISTAGANYAVGEPAPAPCGGFEFLYTKTAPGPAYALYGEGAPQAAGDLLLFTGSIGIGGRSSPVGATLGFEDSSRGVRPLAGWKQDGEFEISVPCRVVAGYASPAVQLLVNDPGTYRVRGLTAINRSAMARIWAPRPDGR